jgi:hypothetical protein
MKALITENNVFYLEQVEVPAQTVEPEVTHHIFVGDRSGSMWGDVEGYKSTIKQVLAVEDAVNPNVETSLISFSSHKDVKLHWSQVPVSEVNDLSKPYMKEVDSIRATFLTGISQGLYLALEQVKEGQTTGITLFTDGYANDPSSYAENKALDAFVQKVQDEYPNVFVNCIGYRDWCDWPRMESIANTLSGKCIKARSFKDVLGAMKDTQDLLAGNVMPAIKVEGQEGTSVLVVNRTTAQVNMGKVGESLSIRGVGAEDNVEVYRVSVKEKSSMLPDGVEYISPYVLKKGETAESKELFYYGVLARAYSGVGEIRKAKDLLFSSGNKTLWGFHQSAMTPSSIAAMNGDFAAWISAGNNDRYAIGRNVRPPHNLFDLAAAINGLPTKSIGIDKDLFYENYRRRSVKSIPGKRNEDGTITPPNAELVPRKNARTYVKSIDFNTSDASVQISTELAVWVKRASDGEVLEEVNFVSLDGLRDYRNYTLVSSGERNVEVLPLEVYTEQAWNALVPFMLPHEVRTFTPGQKAKIVLKKFRMEADECPSASEIRETIDRRGIATAEVKILSAMQDKGAASPYTPEQVAALKELHLSPALYFSAPSTVHYTDKNEAIQKGLIDSFTRYKVNFGTLEILDTGSFRSGNAFLDRRYKVTLNGIEVKKPKLDTYLAGAEYEVKPPNPRAKSTQADEVMEAVADEILLSSNRLSNEGITDRLNKAKEKVDSANRVLQGMVMEIGCTGLLPAELESVADRFDAEDFASKYGVKLNKAQQEGVFYVLPGNVVISITPETSWYTVKTEESVQVAAK